MVLLHSADDAEVPFVEFRRLRAGFREALRGNQSIDDAAALLEDEAEEAAIAASKGILLVGRRPPKRNKKVIYTHPPG